VPSRDPEALARAIADAMGERGTPPWAARKRAARHHVAERFAIERMVQRYHEVWAGMRDAALVHG
jgi:glycosyltransferase involved in cell wall biosynthesis